MEPLSLVCTHIFKAPEKIEAYLVKHKAVVKEDSGRTLMCQLCRDSFEDIIKSGNISNFVTVHESEIKGKILNY